MEWIRITFLASLPVLLIALAFQTFVLWRMVRVPRGRRGAAVGCVLLTGLLAYVLSFIVWMFWPLGPDTLLWNDAFSVPAILAEVVVMPLMLWRFGFLRRE